MPVIKEWETDPYSLAAIWKIEEPERFFIENGSGTFSEIKNEKRRLERLAGRYLLKHLEDDFPLHHIQPDIHDKPRIPEDRFYFSISHSWPYVAAVVSTDAEAGIDIQSPHPRMEQLQHKFLSPREQQFTRNDTGLITLAWCAKEAAYKWQGRRGVDFIEHLPIISWNTMDGKVNIAINLQLNMPFQKINLEAIDFKEFAISYVVNSSK
ncbi:4'-phosphopantetheinyl transferase family protein [Chitinophagaceae bacterium MMS25-I14]